MHRVMTINLTKSMLVKAKANLKYGITLCTKKNIKANHDKYYFRLSDINVQLQVEKEYRHLTNMLNDLEMLCSVSGDILLTAEEYKILTNLNDLQSSNSTSESIVLSMEKLKK